jgi:ribosomal protein S18 acetylase RimI-like enzyme
MPTIYVRPLLSADRDWVAEFVTERWGAETVISHGVVNRPVELPGFVAIRQNQRVGLLTYQLQGESCEIVTIDTKQSSRGIGTALIEAVKNAAREANCKRLWLITTNDNLNALRFYQKRGFVLVAIHRNALARSRQLKPEIPLVGAGGIPLRDEIELEMVLEN